MSAPVKPNADRKFAEVTNLLYYSREIGNYPGDVDTFPHREPTIAARLSWRMGAPGGPARRADLGHSPRTETTRAPHAGAADADVSRDARQRHARRAPLPVVPHAARQQLVVRSAAAAAVGDLCGPDAAGVAATRNAAAAPRGVLAGLALGGPRWHPVQFDQYTAGHDDVRESPDAPRSRGVRQDHDRGALGNWAGQSAGGRGRAQGRIGVGVGPAAAGTVAEAGGVVGRSLVWGGGLCVRRADGVSARRQPFLVAGLPDGQGPRDQAARRRQSTGRAPHPGAAQSQPHYRLARGARDSRAGRALRPAPARIAAVDDPARPARRPRTGARAHLCEPLGARAVLSRNQTAAAPDREST